VADAAAPEVDALIGDASKARELLGWTARVLPPELARIMVEAELAAVPRLPAIPAQADGDDLERDVLASSTGVRDRA
jgi:hypothetical protein